MIIPSGSFDTPTVVHRIRQVPDSFLRTTRHDNWKNATTQYIRSPVVDLTANASIVSNTITITCKILPWQIQVSRDNHDLHDRMGTGFALLI